MCITRSSGKAPRSIPGWLTMESARRSRRAAWRNSRPSRHATPRCSPRPSVSTWRWAPTSNSLQPVQIYPAIDIKRGRVVRVMERGGAETVYADDPEAQAAAFLAAGATWLHVVDLDRAYHTGGDNTAHISLIAATAQRSGASVQVGGLLKDPDEVQRILGAGASRAVVATSAAIDGHALERITRVAPPARLAVALDVREGRPVLRGSKEPVRLG